MNGPKVLAHNSHDRYPALMDADISQRIAELRREIADLIEQAMIYRSPQTDWPVDRVANEVRITRLETILKELAALRPE